MKQSLDGWLRNLKRSISKINGLIQIVKNTDAMNELDTDDLEYDCQLDCLYHTAETLVANLKEMVEIYQNKSSESAIKEFLSVYVIGDKDDVSAAKDFDSYDELAKNNDYIEKNNDVLMFYALALCGESGEFANRIKKIVRDKHGHVSDSDRENLIEELGDILFYVSRSANSIDSSLSEVSKNNIQKIININKIRNDDEKN